MHAFCLPDELEHKVKGRTFAVVWDIKWLLRVI